MKEKNNKTLDKVAILEAIKEQTPPTKQRIVKQMKMFKVSTDSILFLLEKEINEFLSLHRIYDIHYESINNCTYIYILYEITE